MLKVIKHYENKSSIIIKIILMFYRFTIFKKLKLFEKKAKHIFFLLSNINLFR